MTTRDCLRCLAPLHTPSAIVGLCLQCGKAEVAATPTIPVASGFGDAGLAALRFLHGATGANRAGLADGILSAWDRTRLRLGALSESEAQDMARHVGQQLAQDYAPFLGRSR